MAFIYSKVDPTIGCRRDVPCGRFGTCELADGGGGGGPSRAAAAADALCAAPLGLGPHCGAPPPASTHPHAPLSSIGKKWRAGRHAMADGPLSLPRTPHRRPGRAEKGSRESMAGAANSVPSAARGAATRVPGEGGSRLHAPPSGLDASVAAHNRPLIFAM